MGSEMCIRDSPFSANIRCLPQIDELYKRLESIVFKRMQMTGPLNEPTLLAALKKRKRGADGPAGGKTKKPKKDEEDEDEDNGDDDWHEDEEEEDDDDDDDEDDHEDEAEDGDDEQADVYEKEATRPGIYFVWNPVLKIPRFPEYMSSLINRSITHSVICCLF